MALPPSAPVHLLNEGYLECVLARRSAIVL